jgi:hypothetical protein
VGSKAPEASQLGASGSEHTKLISGTDIVFVPLGYFVEGAALLKPLEPFPN